MAYIHKDGSITEGATLGVYRFGLSYTYDSSLDRTTVSATCYNDKDGTSATRSLNTSGRQMVADWYVEANDSIADVYVILKGIDTAPITQPIPCDRSGYGISSGGSSASYTFSEGNGMITSWFTDNDGGNIHLWASDSPDAIGYYSEPNGHASSHPCVNTYTFGGATVYYASLSLSWQVRSSQVTLVPVCNNGAVVTGVNLGAVAWAMIYGDERENTDVTHLIARFEINLHDAGGTTDPELGGGVDWTDPADWDVTYDPTDPSSHTHTLKLIIEGALSGRHNDPLNDTSYSYKPADQKPQQQYGSGGNGGHGGGGGAGASTAIVYKFSTDKAMSKVIVTQLKRHGYGSGGGKGGKGGDGIILIYY